MKTKVFLGVFILLLFATTATYAQVPVLVDSVAIDSSMVLGNSNLVLGDRTYLTSHSVLFKPEPSFSNNSNKIVTFSIGTDSVSLQMDLGIPKYGIINGTDTIYYIDSLHTPYLEGHIYSSPYIKYDTLYIEAYNPAIVLAINAITGDTLINGTLDSLDSSPAYRIEYDWDTSTGTDAGDALREAHRQILIDQFGTDQYGATIAYRNTYPKSLFADKIVLVYLIDATQHQVLWAYISI